MAANFNLSSIWLYVELTSGLRKKLRQIEFASAPKFCTRLEALEIKPQSKLNHARVVDSSIDDTKA